MRNEVKEVGVFLYRQAATGRRLGLMITGLDRKRALSKYLYLKF
jgi:hypothetical protein